MMKHFSSLLVSLFFFLFFFSVENTFGANVTYDSRSLIIDGKRMLFISASIHYPRSVPAMWPGLIQTAKEGGCDVIESYVFWNGHEPSPNNYYFEDRYDLVKFVKTVKEAGMHMILRIGPFVAAEWYYGGVPVWLHYVPGTVFRTNNEPFKKYMHRFTKYVVKLMKKEKLFASQGGPIILAQIENEYGDTERAYGVGAKPYAMWAAKMAVSQNIGVPWIMCQQNDAPDPVINTCNSFYCDQFKPNSPNKPKIWTENWPGWFKTFGASDPHRPPEDIAFAVARFFQKGGSVQNYYMYHGGTNFGRTSGGPFITTSYDYEAPIDEYGLPRLPKWGHLKDLHNTIKSVEHVLLNNEPTFQSLGPLQEVDVYSDPSGACVAFLANTDDVNDKSIVFQNVSYHMPAWSVSILKDCKNEVFNSAKVKAQTTVVEMLPENLQPSLLPPNKDLKGLKWDIFKEKVRIHGLADFMKKGFKDHINTTKFSTDYLWYTTRLVVNEDEEILKKGNQTTLLIESKGHAIHAFVNKNLAASVSGNGIIWTFKSEFPITLKPGENEIALLSMTVGITNAGPYYEWIGAGPTSVKINGLKNGTLDLSSNIWTYKIGLQGEHLGIYKPESLDAVSWESTSDPPKNQPLTWYKTVVDSPTGDEPVGLDMLHMGKGLAWLNGQEIGRYFPVKSSVHDCVSECNYRGKFFPDKCRTGCGEPTQRWYHVPRSWFKPTGNILVIFEEKGGDPTQIRFSKRKVTGVCAYVAENYPPFDLELTGKEGNKSNEKATLLLKCPINTSISVVKFASFGTPLGTCGSFRKGSCHDPNSASVIEKVCLNKNECKIQLTEQYFKKGLCPGAVKKLAVETVCS